MALNTVERFHDPERERGTLLNMPRKHVAIRITDQSQAEVMKIADEHYDGNFSLALRRLLALGLSAWKAGKR